MCSTALFFEIEAVECFAAVFWAVCSHCAAAARADRFVYESHLKMAMYGCNKCRSLYKDMWCVLVALAGPSTGASAREMTVSVCMLGEG